MDTNLTTSTTNTTSSTPQFKSPSIEILHQAFQSTLHRYKQQLPFKSFISHFPDDFALENYDTLQKLYHVWMQTLEANLKKEFENIVREWDLERLLYEKDRNEIIEVARDVSVRESLNAPTAQFTQLQRQLQDVNQRHQRDILQQYQALNQQLDSQIQQKKEKLSGFVTHLNESINKLQQWIEHCQGGENA